MEIWKACQIFQNLPNNLITEPTSATSPNKTTHYHRWVFNPMEKPPVFQELHSAESCQIWHKSYKLHESSKGYVWSFTTYIGQGKELQYQSVNAEINTTATAVSVIQPFLHPVTCSGWAVSVISQSQHNSQNQSGRLFGTSRVIIKGQGGNSLVGKGK